MIFNSLFWWKSFPLIKNSWKERKKKLIFFFFLWFLWTNLSNHAKKTPQIKLTTSWFFSHVYYRNWALKFFSYFLLVPRIPSYLFSCWKNWRWSESDTWIWDWITAALRPHWGRRGLSLHVVAFLLSTMVISVDLQKKCQTILVNHFWVLLCLTISIWMV